MVFLFAPPGAARGETAPGPVIHGGLPVVSPGGSRIVFLSNRGGAEDLFVIGADGTGETQLTRTPEAENARGWTPAVTSPAAFRVASPSSGGPLRPLPAAGALGVSHDLWYY